MKDVAEKASVSKSTVSQYLNKRYEYMGADVKRRIEETIEELGYRPNSVARSLKQKKTSTIGIIFANILHRFSTMASRAVEDYCHENDYHTIVCNADDDPHKEKKYIEMLRDKQVDGVIVFPTGGNFELYEKLVAENYPIVFMDRQVEGVAIPSVKLRNEDAVYQAVDHFFRLGHRRIGILTPPLKVTPRKERINGFKNALESMGLAQDYQLRRSAKIKDIQQELDQMLALTNPPTALISGNDLVLIEVLSYIKKQQINIPNQLALITFDDVPFSELHEPTLSTISQPAFDMGKTAAAYLLNKIKSPEKNTHSEDMLFPGKLKIRDSSEKKL